MRTLFVDSTSPTFQAPGREAHKSRALETKGSGSAPYMDRNNNPRIQHNDNVLLNNCPVTECIFFFSPHRDVKGGMWQVCASVGFLAIFAMNGKHTIL